MLTVVMEKVSCFRFLLVEMQEIHIQYLLQVKLSHYKVIFVFIIITNFKPIFLLIISQKFLSQVFQFWHFII